jgi:hypothetical protein
MVYVATTYGSKEGGNSMAPVSSRFTCACNCTVENVSGPSAGCTSNATEEPLSPSGCTCLTTTCEGATSRLRATDMTNRLSSNALMGLSSSDIVTPSAATHWQ